MQPVVHCERSNGLMQRARQTLVRLCSREAGLKRAIVIIALAAVPAFADDVYLRGGGQITGEIVEQTEDSVTVDVGGGGTMTAHMSSVVRIEKSTSPLQEYRERAASIPAGDAQAWRELAQWAQGRMLLTQSAKAYSQVVAILPDDEEANHALGRVKLNGQWVSEEDSYRAQGYIQFEGEWMTPAERQRILSDRQARQQAADKENQAAIQAIDSQQAAEKKAEEDKRNAEEAWRNPVSWGHGHGPGYWPPPRRRGW